MLTRHSSQKNSLSAVVCGDAVKYGDNDALRSIYIKSGDRMGLFAKIGSLLAVRRKTPVATWIAEGAALDVAATSQLAENGFPVAQLDLARMYHSGDGVRQSYIQAVHWFRQAANQGLAPAQYSLGVMLLEGKGVARKNYAEASEWFRRAAEQGNANAQTNLGAMYADGKGVDQNLAEAHRLWTQAAEQGDASAQFNLALMYIKGTGVPKDDREAVKWLRKGAEQGDVGAQLKMAIAYNAGYGVQQDNIEAGKWYLVAAMQANDSNTDLRKMMKQTAQAVLNDLSPSQIAKAQELADAWKPR